MYWMKILKIRLNVLHKYQMITLKKNEKKAYKTEEKKKKLKKIYTWRWGDILNQKPSIIKITINKKEDKIEIIAQYLFQIFL